MRARRVADVLHALNNVHHYVATRRPDLAVGSLADDPDAANNAIDRFESRRESVARAGVHRDVVGYEGSFLRTRRMRKIIRRKSRRERSGAVTTRAATGAAGLGNGGVGSPTRALATIRT